MSMVRNFVEQDYGDRIQAFSPDACPVEEATELMGAWNAAGDTTVYMAGTFDIPTPNHRLGLAEARLMAGALALGVEYSILAETEKPELLREVGAVAASDMVRLMVTVDTDEGAKQAKAFREEKGNCPKPIVRHPWTSQGLNE